MLYGGTMKKMKSLFQYKFNIPKIMTQTTLTRAQRLNNECTHREYYAQFVTESIIEQVKARIGEKRILQSSDESFNDIPLASWDAFEYSFRDMGMPHKMKECGDSFSLSGVVCIAKEAARQIKESAQ